MDDICGYLSYLRKDHIIKPTFGVKFEHVFMKLLIGEFVGFLKFAILRQVLLNGIISEMDSWLLVLQGIGI